MRLGRIEDVIELARYIGRLSDGAPEGADRGELNGRVRALWMVLDDWGREKRERSPVLGAMAVLLPYLDELDDRMLGCVQRAIENIDSVHSVSKLVDQLRRLYGSFPNEVVPLMDTLVGSGKITYDFEGKVRDLLKMISASFPKESIRLAEKLQQLPGMIELVRELDSQSSLR